jgi:nitroreductase
MSDHYKFVVGLRALRDYESTPISDQHMNAILEAARWTGSSKNLQNWSFVVVQDAGQLAKLAECGDYTVPVRNSAATIAIVEEPGGYLFDSGRVAQNIMLAAAALGVASCPITLHRHQNAADVLGLGEGRTCHYAVTLGYPLPDAGPKMKGGRKPLDELVHWETY